MQTQACLREITQQLKQRGDGTIWIENWKERYGALAKTPKDFLLAHPHLFSLSFEGKKFTIELLRNCKGTGKGAAPGTLALPSPTASGLIKALKKDQPNSGGGGGVIKAFNKPEAQTGGPLIKAWQGPGKGEATTGFGGSAGFGSAGDAVNEIRQQLMVRPDGKVFIDNWKTRYAHLAPTQKDFLESRPDLFTLIYETERRYTVALTDRGRGKGGGKQAAMPALMMAPAMAWKGGGKGGGNRPGDAIREIKDQLRANGDGRVWIADWRDRYGELARTPKEFMESRPDLFTIIQEGKKFTVAINGPKGPKAAAGIKATTGAATAGTKRKRDEPPAKPLEPDEAEELAVAEATRQLRDPKNTEGKVWIPGWGRRFGEILGMTPKQLLELRSDKFIVTELEGTKFKVELIDDGSEDAPGELVQRFMKQELLDSAGTREVKKEKIAKED